MEKRIRFGDLVRKSGRPQIVTLWDNPQRDSSFCHAVQKHRVLTIVQEPATNHKDFGLIGFHEEPHATYLIFPRSLPRDDDSRVIGINYQLVEEPEVKNPVRPGPLKPRRQPAKVKPIIKAFTIKVRRVATQDLEVPVQAPNRRAAQQRVIESLRDQPFELEKAAIHTEILRIA